MDAEADARPRHVLVLWTALVILTSSTLGILMERSGSLDPWYARLDDEDPYRQGYGRGYLDGERDAGSLTGAYLLAGILVGAGAGILIGKYVTFPRPTQTGRGASWWFIVTFSATITILALVAVLRGYGHLT